jgi:hypothetical protein
MLETKDETTPLFFELAVERYPSLSILSCAQLFSSVDEVFGGALATDKWALA